MSIKIYAYYMLGDNSIYAWTESKEISYLFEITRNMEKFVKRKIRIEDENEWKSFEYTNYSSNLFKNILSDGKKSYEFPTTSQENAVLERACEEYFDTLLGYERRLLTFPFTEEMQDTLSVLYAGRRSDTNGAGKFKSFDIFQRLYEDTIL